MSGGKIRKADLHHAILEEPHDFEAWRDKARLFVNQSVSPEQIFWSTASHGERDLFSVTPTVDHDDIHFRSTVRANKAFLRLAQTVILHKDSARFSLLYRLLWWLQHDPHILEKISEPLVHQLNIMSGHVMRDIHKMRAFVRFRVVQDEDGVDRYIAWFEPDHYIVRANAEFFLNRFASQRWSILTPDLCLHWDGENMLESQGTNRHDAPSEDSSEELWRLYYASTFNPARLKVSTMVKEMPRRYWKNLPEAALIPDLIAGAQARESKMVGIGANNFPVEKPNTLTSIAGGIARCRRCAIGCNQSRAVAGEGPANANLLIIGEQPGDIEEKEGRPFVGPAGQLLNEYLERTGFDRSKIRLTNAVRHFKFEQRGPRRIHVSPSASEIDHCRWWLDAERGIIRPEYILTLGASAGRSILGRTPSIAKERGQLKTLPDGSKLFMTVHPSYLLRLDGVAQSQEKTRFEQDLLKLKNLIAIDG